MSLDMTMAPESDHRRWKVTIGQDHDLDDPTDFGYFQVVSFNSRHINSRDRHSIICHFEYSNGDLCEESADYHPPERVVHLPDPGWEEDHHPFVFSPDIVALLYCNDYGHEIKWGIEMMVHSYPPEHPDKDTRYHGVLEWRDDSLLKEFMESVPEEAKYSIDAYRDRLERIVEGTLEEYSMWCSGDCYWVRVERALDPEHCPTCDSRTNDEYEEIESCGGFIGRNHVNEFLQECGMSEEIVRSEDYELKEVWN
jgi:hypothetical protein